MIQAILLVVFYLKNHRPQLKKYFIDFICFSRYHLVEYIYVTLHLDYDVTLALYSNVLFIYV